MDFKAPLPQFEHPMKSENYGQRQK